jgi:hypothetical protein
MKNLNSYQKILGSYIIIIIIFWVVLQLTGSKSGTLNYLYSFMFGLIPFFGGIIGMLRAKLWGGLRSALGKAVFFISLGLFWWGFGESIWSYYNFFEGVAAPYPSLADIGFAQSIFFWVLGAFFLAKASGAWFAFRKSAKARVFTFMAPVLLLAASYYLLVVVARGGTLIPEGDPLLKLILDIAYPLGDFLAATFALVVFTLSYKYFGGFYKRSIMLILLGLAVMYFADFVFSYTTTIGTFYNGNWGDLMLTTGLSLLTFGTLGFATKPAVLKKDVPEQV